MLLALSHLNRADTLARPPRGERHGALSLENLTLKCGGIPSNRVTLHVRRNLGGDADEDELGTISLHRRLAAKVGKEFYILWRNVE